MQGKEMFTIAEIADSAVKKFQVSEYVRINTLKSQIREILKEKNIQAIGKKRSAYAKRFSKAYSEETKNNIIDVWLFNYFLEKSKNPQNNKLKNPDKYEEEAGKWNEHIEKEKEKAFGYINRTDKETQQYEEEQYYKFRERKEVEEAYKKIHKRKMEFMIEAIFSLNYSMNTDELTRDMQKVDQINSFNALDGELTASDIRLFEKIENWENYVEMKKSTD